MRTKYTRFLVRESACVVARTALTQDEEQINPKPS